MAEQKKSNILEEGVQGHRFGKKLTNNDYGTVAFLLSRNDILQNKDKNAKSFSDIELTYNCIYFLIGYEQNSNSTTEMMYVGQAGIRENNQSVLDRLNEHAWKGTDPAKYIDKWTDIVVVTNEKKAWGATELDALEHIFWSLIPVGNRYNSIKPSCTGADLSKFTEAVKQIKEYLDYLQYTMFKEKTDEVLTQNISDIAKAKSEIPVDLDRGTTRIPNITTPPRIVAKMLELLPSEIWNDETKFLDPACKDGGFLRAIYDKLVKDPKLIAKYNGNVDSLKNKILSNLYGIALNQNSKAVTIKNLNGFGYNVTVVTNYVNKLRENKLADIIKEEFGEDMKIDVVIGNPPYQEDTDGGGSKTRGMPLYDKFIINAQEVADTVSMITPVRWYTQPEKEFEALRKTMLNGQLEKLVDFEDATKCFGKCVSIAGGVSYWLWRKDRKGLTKITRDDETWDADLTKRNILLRDKMANDIVDKIDYSKTVNTFDNIVSGVDAFGVRRVPLGVPEPDEKHPIKLLHSSNFDRKYNRGIIEYINEDVIGKNNNYVSIYKIYTEYMNGSGDTVLKSVNILGPNEICDLSYIVIGYANSREIAENVQSYFKTKFVRFLIKATVTNTTVTKNNYCLVPVEDFKHAWTDEMLYQKYRLSETEIAYIESTIKSLDTTVEASPTMKFTLQEAEANLLNRRIQNEEF